MTHEELQQHVESECIALGHWFYAPRNSMTAQRGWPDLVILGSRGALFAELKSADGRRTRPQIQVALRLRQAGLQYRLWRPEHWDDGTIARELETL